MKEYESEMALWAAVINQAFLDAVMTPEVTVTGFNTWVSNRRKRRERQRLLPESENAERGQYMEYMRTCQQWTNENELNRDKARKWLTNNSKDFRHVCEWAGIEPEFIIRKARELQQSGWRKKKAA